MTTRAPRAVAVVDLGFGDAGKGTMVDFLTRRLAARVVVRWNGGAQAGHNVVVRDEGAGEGGRARHHTFAQIGAGSFVPGVRTLLARDVVVHPTALLVEARRLAASGVGDALDRVVIDARARVVTPMHQAVARLRELARGDARHGSCGVGVGETVRDALENDADAIRAGVLDDPPALRRLLARARERLRAAIAGEIRAAREHPDAKTELRVVEDDGIDEAWIDALAPLVAKRAVVGPEAITAMLRDGPLVFEGAQGVLLDEHRGFHPHTTWSTCTFDGALAVLREHAPDVALTRLGVLRAYAVRHGPGPFPTEDAALAPLLPEPHNDHGPWQGAFRVGWLDTLLARYAIAACAGVDGLAITHLDSIARVPDPRACVAYDADPIPGDARFFTRDDHDPARPVRDVHLGPPRDLAHVEALGRALRAVRPRYQPLPRDTDALLAWIASALGAPVTFASSGPTADAKRALG